MFDVVFWIWWLVFGVGEYEASVSRLCFNWIYVQSCIENYIKKNVVVYVCWIDVSILYELIYCENLTVQHVRVLETQCMMH